jgi:type II secretory pathway pseudopilin PulG
MGLRGQGGERGYAMAALLIALAIMAILMSVAMPVWRHEARREKEAELIWRGEQYARAIVLFKRKNQNNPNAWPPSIDVLVEGRFLRKKYKDPMTKDGEFVILPAGGQTTPGIPGTTPQGTPPQGARGRLSQPSQRGGLSQPSGLAQPGAQLQPRGLPDPGGFSQTGRQPMAGGGIMGVRSKSTENSLRSYRGQTRYDQWAFTFDVAQTPGGAIPMVNSPDGRGNTGGRGTMFPGQRGGSEGTGRRGGEGGFNPGTGFPSQRPPATAPGERRGGGAGASGRGPGL